MNYLTKVMVPGGIADRDVMVNFAATGVRNASAPIVERNLVARFNVSPLEARGIVNQAKLRVRREGGAIHRHQSTKSDRTGFVTKDGGDGT
jgi:hypothetical protein